MNKGLREGHLIVLIIALYRKKIFNRTHKNPNTNVQAHPDVTFLVERYHPPPPPPQKKNMLFTYIM